jgi:hypothetical protein
MPGDPLAFIWQPIFPATFREGDFAFTNPNAYICLLSVQACGGVVQLVRTLPLLEVELLEVRISPAVLGLIPGNCRVEAVCANFPNCTDLNYCLSFADQRVTHPT